MAPNLILRQKSQVLKPGMNAVLPQEGTSEVATVPAGILLQRKKVPRTLVRVVPQNKNIFSAKELIQPYFVIEGIDKKEKIRSFPGIYRLSIDNLIKDVAEARDLGVKAVLLFGSSRKKDERGAYAYFQEGIVQKAITAIKQRISDVTVITDVCLCGYTSGGHCGLLKSQNKVIFDKDKTRKALAKIALSHARAGADLVAPSAMMTRQVKVIRDTLDRNGFKKVGILAYSAKYASNFYGPFREALDSNPQFGDRSGYQLDYRDAGSALKEIEQDIKEGASMVMVKPALAYLDIIREVKDNFDVPIAAYNVSGEYAMVKAYCHSAQRTAHSAQQEKSLVLEILTSIKRAGADLIISYHAKEVARWLKK